MDFTERGGLETGFAPVFQAKVRPALMSLEDERLRRRKTAIIWTVGPLVVFGATNALLWVGLEGSEFSFWAIVILTILGVITILAAWGFQKGAWTGAVAKAVMPAVCEHIGDITYDKDAGAGFPVTAMQQLGMIGSYSGCELADRLDGRHRGTGFALVEAKLEKKTRNASGRSSTKTVFKGLLFQIDVPIVAPSRILIGRDLGSLGNTVSTLFKGDTGRGMPRVSFDDSEFEHLFEVHAEDPAATRAFMPAGFRNTLVTIAKREGSRKSKPLMAGFQGRTFYLALWRKGDFLNMGGLNTPVADMEEHLHDIFADIGIVHRIIDRLHGD